MRLLFFIAMGVFVAPLAARAVEADSLIVIMDASQKTQTPATTSAEKPAAAPKAETPASSTTTTTPATPTRASNAPAAAAAAEAIIDHFPGWAISKAGSDTTGQTVETPVSPASPPAPTAPASSPSPSAPEAAKPPPAPASVTDKLWPRDTVPIFMHSCTGLHVEYMPACGCVITKLMLAMSHNEFLELSAANKIDDDPRVISIRSGCLATPAKRKEE